MKNLVMVMIVLLSSVFTNANERCVSHQDKKALKAQIWIQKDSDWTDPKFKNLMERALEVFQQKFNEVGITVGVNRVSFSLDGVAENLSLTEPFFTGDQGQFMTGATNSLFTSISMDQYTNRNINIFLVDQLGFMYKNVLNVPDVLQGTANGVNLPICDFFVQPLCVNGVILGANGQLNQVTYQIVGNRIAHEIGHFFGLFHVSGAGAQFGLQQIEAEVDQETNLMNTSTDQLEKDRYQSFSCLQTYIMKQHPHFQQD